MAGVVVYQLLVDDLAARLSGDRGLRADRARGGRTGSSRPSTTPS
jgi:hypothetical protein